MSELRVHARIDGRRTGGKSLMMAAVTAAHLKAGGRAVLATSDQDGKMTCEPVVCVPGFDDGRQITDQRKARRATRIPLPLV